MPEIRKNMTIMHCLILHKIKEHQLFHCFIKSSLTLFRFKHILFAQSKKASDTSKTYLKFNFGRF